MKTLTNRIALFAASAVVLGTMAYGQTNQMKADIPFAFHAGNGVLPAGEYTVSNERTPAGSAYTTLRSVSLKKGVIALGSPNDAHAAGSPILVFRCARQGCALAAIRSSQGTVTYNSGKAWPKEEVATITVPLRVVNGD
jgi:hypothetical protein